MEGQFPVQLAAMTVNGKYLTAIPYAKAADYHRDTSVENNNPMGTVNDAGGWAYGDPVDGLLLVNCTHTDTKGSVWSTY